MLCRDQLLVSLDNILEAVTNFKAHTTVRSSEKNKNAEKAIESVKCAIADLVAYLKDSVDDPVLLARENILAACNEVLASETAREAVKGARKTGEKMRVMISTLKEQASETDDPDLQVKLVFSFTYNLNRPGNLINLLQYFLLNAIKLLADHMRTLIEDTKNYGRNPSNPEIRDKLMEKTKIQKELTICLAEEVKERRQMKKMMGSADEAIEATKVMIEKAKESNIHNTNEATRTQLAKDIKPMEKRIDQLQKAMKTALVDPDDTTVNKVLMDSIQNFVRVANR